MIAIVIVNYRNPLLTIQSVMSVYKHARMPVQLILIDNSEDGGASIEVWKQYEWPQDFMPVEILESATTPHLSRDGFFWMHSPNKGFAAANNLALRVLSSSGNIEYVLLLNNDAFLMQGSLEVAVRYMEQSPSIGLLGFTILDNAEPSVIQYVGGKYNVYSGRLQLLEAGKKFSLPENFHHEIDYPAGAAMMVRVLALKDVGYMDESFFLYGEEMDWSNRLRQLKWKIDYCFEATVRHVGSATINGNKNGESVMSDFYWLRSRLLLSKKRGGFALFTFVICSLLFPLRRLLKGQWSRVYMYLWIMTNPKMHFVEFSALRNSTQDG